MYQNKKDFHQWRAVYVKKHLCNVKVLQLHCGPHFGLPILYLCRALIENYENSKLFEVKRFSHLFVYLISLLPQKFPQIQRFHYFHDHPQEKGLKSIADNFSRELNYQVRSKNQKLSP